MDNVFEVFSFRDSPRRGVGMTPPCRHCKAAALFPATERVQGREKTRNRVLFVFAPLSYIYERKKFGSEPRLD